MCLACVKCLQCNDTIPMCVLLLCYYNAINAIQYNITILQMTLLMLLLSNIKYIINIMANITNE